MPMAELQAPTAMASKMAAMTYLMGGLPKSHDRTVPALFNWTMGRF
jgi:hypothetical protein